MRSEFDFIYHVKSRYNLSKVGDDCAVLPKSDTSDLLITSDMLVEGIDFRLEWAPPEKLGHKSLAVSLSDIAAMGGTATHAMLSIALVENLWKGDFLDRFYAGWHELAWKFGVELIGGDISRTSGPLTIDSTVIGEVPTGTAIRRSGARPGDGVYVVGSLGGAAGGLRLLETGDPIPAGPARELADRQLQPLPQLAAANYLRTHGLAAAMIDVSDGLSSDLLHICEASGVGAEIDSALIPVHHSLPDFFPMTDAFEMAMNGGEDLALMFTGDDDNVSMMHGITRIGTITATPEVVELISGSERRTLSNRGFRHF